MHTLIDSLGVMIQVDDVVIVNAWGSPVRLTDTGRRAKVVGFTRRGSVILETTDNPADPIARGNAVRPEYLGVARRDGAPGFEGNR